MTRRWDMCGLARGVRVVYVTSGGKERDEEKRHSEAMPLANTRLGPGGKTETRVVWHTDSAAQDLQNFIQGADGAE